MIVVDLFVAWQCLAPITVCKRPRLRGCFPSVRGLPGDFPSMMLSVRVFAVPSGYLFTSWRTICWIMSTVSVSYLSSPCTWLRRVPYWLIQNGRKVEALDSLDMVPWREFDISDEFNEIVPKKEEKQDDGLKEDEGRVLLPFLLAPPPSLGASSSLFSSTASILAMFDRIFQDAKLSLTQGWLLS